MSVDARLVQKGRRELREALLQQARISLELARQHQESLSLDGWPVSRTEALEKALVALESQVSSKTEASRSARERTRAEAQARSEAKAFLRRLRNALPVVLREVNLPDLHAGHFSPQASLQRSTPNLLAHLRTIRASVERLDEPLKAHFRGELASVQLDKVRSALEAADTEQEVTLTSLPLETRKVMEAKGRVLELIEDLNRAARNAFEGNARMIALFNKDILLRARRARPAEPPPQPPA